MRQLNDREQRYAYVGAGFAAAVSVALWARSFDQPAAIALTGIGLIMAALLAVAARRRSRLFTGLASILVAFGPWGMAWVVGLPFLVLAAWLAFKTPRLQPLPEPEGDEHGEIVTRPGPPMRERRPPGRPKGRRGARGTGGQDGAPDAASDGPVRRSAPSPSKRYTPPQHHR